MIVFHGAESPVPDPGDGGGCDLMDGCDAPALALCETSRATLPHPVSFLFLESVFKPIIQHASPSGGEAFDGVYWRLVKYVPRYSLGSAARARTTHVCFTFLSMLLPLEASCCFYAVMTRPEIQAR